MNEANWIANTGMPDRQYIRIPEEEMVKFRDAFYEEKPPQSGAFFDACARLIQIMEAGW